MTQNSINVTASTGAPIKVNVTAPSSQGAVTLSQDTSAYNAKIAEQWAISDKMVLQKDYSSKYYATKAKDSENSAKNYANVAETAYNIIQDSANGVLADIETARVDAVDNITTVKSESIASVEAKGNEVLSTVNEGIAEINDTKTTILNDIEFVADGEKKEIEELIDNGKEELKESIGDVKVLTTLEIGDIGIAPLGIDETQGKRRYLNGQVIIQEQYEQFTNKVKTAIELYPSLACTESEWQTTATMTVGGQVGKFVVDDNAGTIRLPKIIMPIQGLTNIANLGEIVEAGLPNITGSLNSSNTKVQGYYREPKGAFQTLNGSRGTFNAGESSSEFYNGLSFDASLSNPIYGNSDTVQPEAIQYPYFIQVATGAETEDNITNTIELNNPFSLLDYKYSEYELNNLSWLRSNGQYNSKVVYPAVYELLLKIYNGTETKAGVSVKLTSETFTDYDFVLNTNEEAFRLPIQVKLASGKAVVGNGLTLGLTNGTGYAGLYAAKSTNDTLYLGSTSSYGQSVGEQTDDKGSLANSLVGITTDPTKSGIETSDSGLHLYFYVGETVQNANLINAGRIEEKLAGKVDYSVYLNTPRVIETYYNGYSGYRIWSPDQYGVKRCQQWGSIQDTSGGEKTITFLKPFADATYFIVKNVGSYYSGNSISRYESCYNLTATGFTTYYNTDYGQNAYSRWYADGYIN